MSSGADSTHRMLKKLKTDTIKSILRDCNEPTHGQRCTLAREASVMLTLTSDEEDDEEDDEKEEAEADADDYAEMTEMIRGCRRRGRGH